MSRNNKNATRKAQAKAASTVRKSGGSGPAKTTAKHGKKKAWWQMFKSYSDFVHAQRGRPATV